MTLQSVADDLYGTLPEEFIARRNARAKEVRAGGDRELAARIGKLPKPRTSAWVLNMLVRGLPDEIDQLIVLGAQIREAQTNVDGDGLRALDHQRRQLTGALTQAARTIAGDLGHPVNDPLAAEVENTLRAAMADPAGGAALRTGLLVDSFGTTGLEPVEVEVVAVPDAVSAPPPRPTPQPPRPSSPPPRPTPQPARRLKVVRQPAATPRKRPVPEPRVRRQAQEALEQARTALAEADQARDRAAQSHAAATEHREELEAERSQLQERLRTIDRDLTRAHRAEDKADRERLRTEREHAGAQRAVGRAERIADDEQPSGE
ncbi:MAG: hypothetical protein ACRDO7_00445 [Nocardioidaceae bacterium]